LQSGAAAPRSSRALGETAGRRRRRRAMFIGVDCGTQGTKALVVDEAGRVFGRGHATHGLIERDSGAREQHPSIWVEAL
ncbi:hypothetical protein J8J27_34775, partial [Mycobacterium tuberculosis]|nr:hypothetical protein [Mycobacterium tuberculosis]